MDIFYNLRFHSTENVKKETLSLLSAGGGVKCFLFSRSSLQIVSKKDKDCMDLEEAREVTFNIQQPFKTFSTDLGYSKCKRRMGVGQFCCWGPVATQALP